MTDLRVGGGRDSEIRAGVANSALVAANTQRPKAKRSRDAALQTDKSAGVARDRPAGGAANARSTEAPSDKLYGDCRAGVRDSRGNSWLIAMYI